jgi:hypothetical protein
MRVSENAQWGSGLRRLVFTLLIFISTNLCAEGQDSMRFWNVQAHLDTYLSTDLLNPNSKEKPSFIFNHRRNNQLALNLAMLRAAYDNAQFRASVGGMLGDYSRFNLAAEPLWARSIYEAQIGFRLHSRYDVWLDAGIMPSHIGYESAISQDCWTPSRSLVAENSPYYESGAKLSYTTSKKKWFFSLLLLNGWQRIARITGMQKPSYGAQLKYQGSNWTANYSCFYGSDRPDSMNHKRFYQNGFLQFEPNGHWSGIIGLDMGRDHFKGGSTHFWYTPSIIIRYSYSKKWRSAFRVEYFHDQHEVMIQADGKGSRIAGCSLNTDVLLFPKCYWRFELKYWRWDKNNRTNPLEMLPITTVLSYQF